MLFDKKVLETIKKNKLISPKDRVLVALSGGKDSLSCLYILNKHFKNVSALIIDLKIGNFSKENLKNSIEFCEREGIKLNVATFEKEFGHSVCYIRSLLKSKGGKLGNCAVCGVLKRYLLNKWARKNGFNKIATGHNLDDECQNIIMNFLRGNLVLSSRLGVVSGVVKDKKFVTRIKPLYFCSEKEILKFVKGKKWKVYLSLCSCSVDAYRRRIRSFEFSEDEKFNIVNNFLKILPSLRKKYGGGSVCVCGVCGEPAKGKVCRSCELIGMIK